jgi:phosphinothricin acetyltransferase
VIIRPATRSDLASLVDLYNHYVTNSHCTFDTQPFTEATREPWWSRFDGQRHQCWLAAEADLVTGYACATPMKSKAAYATSAEVSVYVAADSGGRGIGRQLYDTLLAELEGQDLHRAYALIALPNAASIALHERCGFSKVAHLHEVGRKFDHYWDVAWYEREL